MAHGLWKTGILGIAFGLVASAASALPVVMTMQVSEINGVAQPDFTTEVSANPGDVLRVEFYMESWAPHQIQAYQFGIHGPSFTSGGDGAVEQAVVPCSVDSDCEFLLSCPVSGACECLDAIFVDELHPDYLWNANDPILSAGSCQIAPGDPGGPAFPKIGGVDFIPTPGSGTDDGTRKYGGTLILTLNEDACGDFTIEISSNSILTLVKNTLNENLPIDVSLTLLIHAPADNCGQTCLIVDSVPADCDIDAGEPHDINNTNLKKGREAFEITVDAACDASALGVADFVLRQVPDAFPAPPSINSVVPAGGDTVIVGLDGPTNPLQWTCISLAADPAQEVCSGYLPGDVGGDGTTGPPDILAVIDSLNGVVPRPLYAADVDRSGVAGPPDILRVIDLLNGAGRFQSWFGAGMPTPCPVVP